MAAKPLLTVLVLTYNHEKTLARTLDSIFNQETKHAYEIVIAEDCSEDNTQMICRRYAKKYPDKIRLRLQKKNTKSRHVAAALWELRTKYITVIEGDDYWCDKDRVQLSIDYLETHPDVVTFAHDTNYDYIDEGIKKSLVHDIHGIKTLHNPMKLESFVYLHTSARTYRNCVDLKSVFKGGELAGDFYLSFLYLDKGPLYFYDKIMSVYTVSGKGEWSKLTKQQQLVAEDEAYFVTNKLLDYRYDDFFESRVSNAYLLRMLKRLFGKRLGWIVYMKRKKGLVLRLKEVA